MFPVRSPVNPVAPAARPTHAFATTHWSLVLDAADAGSAEGRAALEELCRSYWPPLYHFARRRGLAPCDAEDLTQGFFADLLKRGAIARADATRGRFRTFLLAAFENFAGHQRACVHRRKRGGGCEIMSLEALGEAEGHFLAEPATEEAPGRLYDRQWAMSLLDRALAAVRRDYAAANKGVLFTELKDALWGGGGEVNYRETAARLGMTEGALQVAVHRLRRRFGEQLRARVAETVGDPGEIEAEVRDLLEAFRA